MFGHMEKARTIAQQGRVLGKKREEIPRSSLCTFMLMSLGLANACGDDGIEVSHFFKIYFRKDVAVVNTEPETRQDTSRVSVQWPEWAGNAVITKEQCST